MKWLHRMLLVLVIAFTGCGSQRVPVAGSYFLEMFPENGRFYLRQRGDGSVGGVFDGYLLQIGANQQMVIAYVKRLSRGDPDGWYSLDIKTGEVSGPLTEFERSDICGKNGIICEPIDDFWARKKEVGRRVASPVTEKTSPTYIECGYRWAINNTNGPNDVTASRALLIVKSNSAKTLMAT